MNVFKTRGTILATTVFLVVTIATLLTTIEHHRKISERYGEIANIFMPLITISSFALGAFISLIFQWGINVIQFERIVKLLPAGERTVMELLFAKRIITQADLSSETGLSRVIVSRIISNLEKKGVVTKKPMENTNLIESKIYRMHPTTQILTKFPGLSEKRMLSVIAIVFLFGISLSVLNSFHMLELEHPLEPSTYILAVEFFPLGWLTSILLRKKIAHSQFERILEILPEDERNVLRILYTRKTITQKELVEKTGAYKMKVSRIIQDFEQAGIIDKKPYGYTNRIISKI